MRTSVRRTTASSQTTIGTTKQLTLHKYTNDDVDFQQLRGAHCALSLHTKRTVPHFDDDTAHLMTQVLSRFIVHPRSCSRRVLFDLISPLNSRESHE